VEFNFFGAKFQVGRVREAIQEEVLEPQRPSIREEVILDNSRSDMLGLSHVVGIAEAVTYNSPAEIKRMLDSNEIKMGTLIEALKSEYSSGEVYKENEEMSKDTIIGSAMELMADDSCLEHPQHKKIVFIESTNAKLQEYLNTFLEKNVKIDNRIWEWAFEVVKHGDFKLRRMEFETGESSKNVYYENVMEGYKVSRIEYLGNVLGYLDEDAEKPELLSKDSFVHFISTKLPNRKKVKLKIKKPDDSVGEITCYKVGGTSLVDNARYIYRIVNLLDNMLIMSRVARSTQYNIIKIEVGNASPLKTQEILMDVRRRIEGSTRMTKGKGMRTDPSPIPVNSNVYIPTREGKGDITVDSVNDSIDVKSIVDIDYFRNKEFATIKTPKAYLGFEEEMPGQMGNQSLVKLDIRYARTVKRVQNILKYGIKELCNNYLRFRGRVEDIDEFDVCLASVTSAEDASRIDDVMAHLSVFDTLTTLLTEFGEYLSKPKLFLYLSEMIGLNVTDIASEKMKKIIRDYEKGRNVDDKGEATDTTEFTDGEVPDEEMTDEEMTTEE
jgi:hypothetical protein